MPDPVSCHPAHNDPSIIECDPVFIGPQPARAPAAENPSSQPGVRALVAGHEPPLRVRTQTTIQVPQQVGVGELAGQCAGKVAGAILAVAGATKLHPALGILSALKAGFDIAECSIETIDESSQRASEARAVEECVNSGGTTLGAVNGVLTCEMPREQPEQE
jgi:hypothetical protein